MYNIITQLEGGDRRSIGKSDDVAVQVLQNSDLFPDLFNALKHTDAVVRMRAADAIEKITRKRPDLLQPFKEEIIESISKIEQ